MVQTSVCIHWRGLTRMDLTHHFTTSLWWKERSRPRDGRTRLAICLSLSSREASFRQHEKEAKLNCSVVYYLQEEDQEMKQKKMFSWHSCIVETILILLLLGLIPGAVLTVEMIFSYGTQYIPDQCLKELYSNSLLCRPLNVPEFG